MRLDKLCASSDEAEQSNDVDLCCQAGLILYRNLAHYVVVDNDLLITDVRAWAKGYADVQAEYLHTLPDGTQRSRLNEMCQNVQAWALGGGKAVLDLDLVQWGTGAQIAPRVELGFLRVTRGNFDEYLDAVMEHVALAQSSFMPHFLLIAGPGKPKLYVSEGAKLLAQFASPWIRRKIISQRDLLTLCSHVVRDYPDPGRDVILDLPELWGRSRDEPSSEDSLSEVTAGSSRIAPKI